MEYSPSAFLSADKDTSNPSTVDLIILNQPLQDFETFKRIWSHTRYRICADGGANRLYDLFSGSIEKHRTEFVSCVLITIRHSGFLLIVSIPSTLSLQFELQPI